MAVLGLVVGLIAGGLLVTYANWRWVMFINVPIGLVVAALATRALPGRRLAQQGPVRRRPAAAGRGQ